MCRAELRRLKEIYPAYQAQVAFYAVGFDQAESLEALEAYRRDQGYPWPVALGGGQMLADLKVLRQSTKVAVDRRGIIVYRDGYGSGDDAAWRRVLGALAEGGG